MTKLDAPDIVQTPEEQVAAALKFLKGHWEAQRFEAWTRDIRMQYELDRRMLRLAAVRRVATVVYATAAVLVSAAVITLLVDRMSAAAVIPMTILFVCVGAFTIAGALWRLGTFLRMSIPTVTADTGDEMHVDQLRQGSLG